MVYKSYDKYKDSEVEFIGKIPNDWNILKSGLIFERYNYPSSTGEEELLSVSEYYGVKPKKNLISEGDFLSRAESLVGYKKCFKNDLVMNIMLAWKKGLGITDYDGIVSPAYEVFKTDTSKVIPNFMNYLLRTDMYGAEFKRYSYGIRDSRLRLYPDNFKNIPCILPSLNEQKIIVEYLDKKLPKVDINISKNKELISLLEEKKSALINQCVTKGLDLNSPMKDSGFEWIGEVPENWDFITIDHFVDVVTDYVANGSFATIKENVTYKDDEDYAILLRLADNTNNFKGPFVYIDEHAYNFLSKTKLKEGDIVLSNIGSIGSLFKVPNLGKPMSLGPNVILVKFNNDINRDYFFYWFNCLAGKGSLDMITTVTTQPKFNKTDFRKVHILCPSIEDQEQIINYLDDKLKKIDYTINNVQSQIDLLEEYKQSLIYHVVTGKVDVREVEV